MLSGIPGLLKTSPPRTPLLSVLVYLRYMLDTSTHLTGICAVSHSKMVGSFSTWVRFFTRKCCKIRAVFPLFTSPACGGFTISGGQNTRALLGGQDVAPLFLPPRALKLYSVGGDVLFNCTFGTSVPFALLTADSDSYLF